jgi:hypothetical protein
VVGVCNSGNGDIVQQCDGGVWVNVGFFHGTHFEKFLWGKELIKMKEKEYSLVVVVRLREAKGKILKI